MPQIIAPPPPTHLTFADEGGLNRIRFRLWQVLMTAVTISVAGWFCTFGPIPAILALMVAKHVLVAILVMGIDVVDRGQAV